MTLDHLTYSTEHAARQWHDAFTFHLDLLPPLIEMIIWTSMPSIRVSRFDQIKITGGGFIDNIPDEIPGEQALHDARELWTWLVSYTRAVDEWITPERPAPVLADKPDADPLTARSLALTTIGWLIDHAHQIHDVAELDEHTEAMFTTIRSLRGRYGVFPKPRRRLEMCTTCGERQVAYTWETNPNGSPKPIRVGKCRRCGQTYDVQEATAPVPAPIVLSQACADLKHDECESLHCECQCGHKGAEMPEKVTAADLLHALRRKHSSDAVVREVVIDDPVEFAIRRRAEIERARQYGEQHAERTAQRYQGKLIADVVPEGWDYRSSKPQRRIDALLIASTGTTAVEIKVTRADFKRDTESKRRAWRSVTDRFVYLVPKGLVAGHEVAQGCGLWEFDAEAVGAYRWQHGITSVKRAVRNKHPEPLPFQVLRSLAYRVSNAEWSASAPPDVPGLESQ